MAGIPIVRKESIRSVIFESKIWFPLVDMTTHCKDGDKIHSSAIRWLKSNVTEGGLAKIKVQGTAKRRGGTLLCVDSENVRIVGMYEAHLKSGKDFRAKWADLPDTPFLETGTRLEISWRNLYKWSVKDHALRGGAGSSYVRELRVVAHRVSTKLQIERPEDSMSYAEALKELGLIGGTNV